MTIPYLLREPTESDVGFVVTSWLMSAGDAWNKIRTAPVWAWRSTGIQLGHFADLTRRFTRDCVAHTLQRETCRVVIACDVEDPDVIFGFAVCEPARGIVHWAYVKHDFRSQGIGRALVEHLMGPSGGTPGYRLTYLPREFVAMQSKWGVRFDPHAK